MLPDLPEKNLEIGMYMIDLNKLKEVVQKATPGPWEWTSDDKGYRGLLLFTFKLVNNTPGEDEVLFAWNSPHYEACLSIRPQDMDFISTFNPEVIENLIKCLEEAKRECEDLRVEAEKYAELSGRNAARAQKAEAELVRRDAADPYAWERTNCPECDQLITKSETVAQSWIDKGWEVRGLFPFGDGQSARYKFNPPVIPEGC